MEGVNSHSYTISTLLQHDKHLLGNYNVYYIVI